MKYSMYSHFAELFKERGIESAAEYAVSHGFSAVEFLDFSDTPFMSANEARRAREIFDEKGLAVSCYSVGVNLFGSDEKEENLKFCAEIAAALGSPYLHHTLVTPYHPIGGGLSFDEVLSDILPRAKRIADYAQSLGVICLYEEQGHYFNGMAQFRKFFSEIKAMSDNVGVCGDFGNILFVHGDPGDFFEEFASDIKHVHVKDYRVTETAENSTSLMRGDGKFMTETALGNGLVNVDRCMAALSQAGYDGYFSFELAFPFPVEYEQMLSESINYLGSKNL